MILYITNYFTLACNDTEKYTKGIFIRVNDVFVTAVRTNNNKLLHNFK